MHSLDNKKKKHLNTCSLTIILNCHLSLDMSFLNALFHQIVYIDSGPAHTGGSPLRINTWSRKNCAICFLETVRLPSTCRWQYPFNGLRTYKLLKTWYDHGHLKKWLMYGKECPPFHCRTKQNETIWKSLPNLWHPCFNSHNHITTEKGFEKLQSKLNSTTKSM